MRPTCAKCGATDTTGIRMMGTHDSWCCPACDRWLEPPCDCVQRGEFNCPFINRPEKPSMVEDPEWWT